MARKRAGSEFSPTDSNRKSSFQPEESSLLDEVDVENLESNYFYILICVRAFPNFSLVSQFSLYYDLFT